MRILAFGDIHGCLTSLKTLWEAVQPQPEDLVVFLGDYVDRGPDSKGVIDFLIANREAAKIVFLTVNHEEKMLLSRINTDDHGQWLEVWDAQETLDSYGLADVYGVPDEHWEFLRKCKPHFQTDTHIFIHANLEADIPVEEQQPFTIVHKKLITIDPHFSGKTVIVGHTAQKNHRPLNLGHCVCIDTDTGRGGWLTCLDVATGQYTQANEEAEVRQGEI